MTEVFGILLIFDFLKVAHDGVCFLANFVVVEDMSNQLLGIVVLALTDFATVHLVVSRGKVVGVMSVTWSREFALDTNVIPGVDFHVTSEASGRFEGIAA